MESPLNSDGRSRPIWAAAGGLCCVGLWGLAIASPPLSRAEALLAAGRSFAHQEHTAPARLDLRLSAESLPEAIPSSAAALGSAPFPSAIRHLNLGKADLANNDDRTLPSSVGADELRFQVMGRAKMLVSRVRREGLPVARLWESKSALLSIGLNQRGKPGLWLTQKIR
jgi:hypothetical protein